MGTNKYLVSKIGSFLDVSVTTFPTLESFIKIDSHANLVFHDRNRFVLNRVHVHTCDVETFNLSIGKSKKVQIIDAAVAYTFPYTHETSILITRNAFYVPSMDNNLIPPFVIWESRVHVCDTPKINCQVSNNNLSRHLLT